MGQVAWPEIMLIVGVSTYVVVLEKMGTISFVGNSVAGLASPLLAALLLCLIGAVVSAFASSTAVLGSLIPLAVPFLQAGTGVSAIGFIAAMAVASTIVDVSPFSTNGALVLANAQGVDRDAFFRKLMIYGMASRLSPRSFCGCCSWCSCNPPTAESNQREDAMSPKQWNNSARNRADRLARTASLAKGKQVEASRATAVAGSGDRARRPRRASKATTRSRPISSPARLAKVDPAQGSRPAHGAVGAGVTGAHRRVRARHREAPGLFLLRPAGQRGWRSWWPRAASKSAPSTPTSSCSVATSWI